MPATTVSAAAAPHRGTFQSSAATAGRACARSCVRSFRGAPTRRVPGREGEAEAGARRDTAPGQSRPPRAAVRSGCCGVAGGDAVGPRRGRLLRRVRHLRDRGVWDASSSRCWATMRLSSASGGWGCGILSSVLDCGVALVMGCVYSSSCWGWQWQGRPRSSQASSIGSSSLEPPALWPYWQPRGRAPAT